MIRACAQSCLHVFETCPNPEKSLRIIKITRRIVKPLLKLPPFLVIDVSQLFGISYFRSYAFAKCIVCHLSASHAENSELTRCAACTEQIEKRRHQFATSQIATCAEDYQHTRVSCWQRGRNHRNWFGLDKSRNYFIALNHYFSTWPLNSKRIARNTLLSLTPTTEHISESPKLPRPLNPFINIRSSDSFQKTFKISGAGITDFVEVDRWRSRYMLIEHTAIVVGFNLQTQFAV